MSVPPSELEIELASVDGESGTHDSEAKKIAGRSPGQLAVSRLRRDKVSLIAFIIVILAGIAAVLAPLLQSWGVLDPYSYNSTLIDRAGNPIGGFSGASWSHPFGVEPGTGRDVLSRVMLGISFSMLIATGATLFSAVVGMIVGIIAGYSGGASDFWLSRWMDLILAFPQLLMLLSLSSVLRDRIAAMGVPNGTDGPQVSSIYLISVLGFFGWPYLARIVRGQVLTLRNREFVEAARSLGALRRRIWFTELMPNLWAPLIIYVSLTLPLTISAEAALSYLGVGLRAPTPSLGNILNDSSGYYQSDRTYFLLPGVVLVLIVLAFNMFGDGLRDALDPKSNR